MEIEEIKEKIRHDEYEISLHAEKERYASYPWLFTKSTNSHCLWSYIYKLD